jgi:hypothetical protein
MKRTFENGVSMPPALSYDQRMNSYQQGMSQLFSAQNVAQPGYGSDFQQWSSMALSTTSVPASTPSLLGNPRVELLGAAIEIQTIFRAEEGDAAVILGAGGVAPLAATMSSAFAMTRMRVNSHLPSPVPVRGRVRMGTIEQSQVSARLSSYGVGLEMGMRAFLDRDGPLLLRLAIEQNAVGMVDFMILMVYNMLQSAFNFGLHEYEKFKTKYSLNVPLRYVEWLERDKLFLGAMQREDHPIEVIMGYVKDQMRLINRVPDIILANHRLERYMHNIRAYTEFFRAGPTGPGNVVSPNPSLLASKLGLVVHTVRTAVIDDQSEFDFMTNTIRYGEFVPMLQVYSATTERPYRTEWRDVWLMDRRSDSWRRIPFRDALLASGRWGPDGKLINIDDLTQYDGTPADYDPFSVRQANGKLRPITYFGEMPDLAVADLRHFGTNTFDPLLANAIATLRDFAESCRNAPHTEDVEIMLRDCTINADGSVNLSNTKSYTLGGKIPYFGTASGIRSIAASPGFLARCGVANGDVEQNKLATALVRITADFTNAGANDKLTQSAIIDAAIGANYPAVYLFAGDERLTRPGTGASSLVSVASPIAIGDALRISSAPRTDIEARLTGSWAQQGGGLRLVSNDSAALVGSLLRHTGGMLDVRASDRNAVAALSLIHNYGYTNAANAEGVHATEHLRGLALAGLQHVATDGGAEAVSARIGTYLNWLQSERVVPDDLTRPLAAPATRDQVKAFPAALTQFASSDAGKAVFGANVSKLSSSARAIGASAGAVTVADVGARLGGAAHIGAPALDTLPGNPSQYKRTPLQYTKSQLEGYLRIANNKDVPATAIKLENPVRPSMIAGLAELEAAVRSPSIQTNTGVVINFGSEIAAKLTALERQTNSASLFGAVKLLFTETYWETIEAMLTNNEPIPIVPYLLRWRALLTTAGMIATKRGAQRAFYAFPIFSLTDDDSHQWVRAQTKFEAGTVMIDQNATYHIHNVLITGSSYTGFNTDFATREGLHRELTEGDVFTGSIVVLLEPPRKDDDIPPLISAHGSWKNAGITMAGLADAVAPHFSSIDWMRKYWGLAPPATQHSSFTTASTSPEILAMWRGAVRYFDPNTGREGSITAGCGPLSSHWFYDRGMFTAWDAGTAYPAQSTTKTLVA